MKKLRYATSRGNEKVSDFIVVLPKLISSADLSNIVAHFENNCEWHRVSVQAVDGDRKPVKPLVSSYNRHIVTEDDPFNRFLDDKLRIAFNEYVRQVSMPVFAVNHNHQPPWILRYQAGATMDEHHDSAPLLAISIALNNDFNGGAVTFFNGTLEVELEAGDAVLFPTNFIYMHRIEPVISGTRYSLVKRW